MLPGGGGWVTLHFSAALGIVGAAPGPAPSAHASLSPVFPGPLGKTPSLWLQGIQGCCLWEDIASWDPTLSSWRCGNGIPKRGKDWSGLRSDSTPVLGLESRPQILSH